jgi:hypothetical protein
VLLEEFREVVLVDEGVAGLESGNLSLVIIHADDIVAHFGKADGSDQTNISRPNYGNFDVFTHSAVVLFLMFEDNRTLEESRRVMIIAALLKPMRRRVHLMLLLDGTLG